MGVLMAIPSFAEDFTYTYNKKYTLTYTVIDENAKTCKPKDGRSNTPGNKVSGALEIPETAMGYTVVEIGTSAFCGTALTSVTIPASVTKIGNDAFSNCGNLTSIEIPNSVTTIGNNAFRGAGLTSLTLGNSVTRIGASAFQFCPLKSLVIPNSVTRIGPSAFGNCDVLTSLTLGNSVNYIDYSAFAKCSGLTSIEIPNSVISIGNYAFWNCTGLTSMTIPESVTNIGEGIFMGCSQLTGITVAANNENYCSVDNSIYSKDMTTFVQYPVGKTGDFAIPESVTRIAGYAFYGSVGLSSLTIPASVATIDRSAFEDCSGLTAIYYGSESPITCDSNVFSESTYNNAALYVPQTAVEKCKEIDPWKNFTNIVAHTFSGIEEINTAVDASCPCEIYNLNGMKVADTTEGLAPGLYIRKQGSKTGKFIVR